MSRGKNIHVRASDSGWTDMELIGGPYVNLRWLRRSDLPQSMRGPRQSALPTIGTVHKELCNMIADWPLPFSQPKVQSMATKCEHCPIRRKDLFLDMSANEVALMQKFKAGELVVDPGTPVLLQGSNSPQLFTVLHGMGLRYRMLSNGERQVVNFVFPGEFLGLQAGLMGEMGHSVEATTKLTLCVFDRKELWNFIKANPEKGFEMAWLAAVEEHFLGSALTTVGQRTALQAVSWAFVKLYLRAQASGSLDGNRMRFPFRQQDLADALGISLVHTNKMISKLRNQQLISWEGEWLRVLDLHALGELGITEIDALPRRPIF